LRAPRNREGKANGHCATARAFAHLLGGDLYDGPLISRFEQAFARFIGVRHAIAVPSGRAGLRFILDGLQLDRDAEIIVSAYGYPVVPFLVKTLGYRLRFVDCELQTLGMDPDALAAAIGPNTRAVITTHLFGVPCRICELREIVDRHNAYLVEDCAHVHGARIGDTKAGAFGQAAYFSFETTKFINTMGGGMITTSDDAFVDRVRLLRDAESPQNLKWLLQRLFTTTFEALVTWPPLFEMFVYPALTAMPRKTGDADRFASGYDGDEITLVGKMGRYTNYQAALGIEQLASASMKMQRHAAVVQRMLHALQDVVRLQKPSAPDVCADHMLLAALVPDMPAVCDRLLRFGIDAKHHYMRDCSGLFETGETFPRAAEAEREVLHLPCYAELSKPQQDHIIRTVQRIVGGVDTRRRA
jgi:dTDP-4-amino-4,6-dideoxygalactose transaminase